ncbi:hypothetical protein GY45DRAFT_1374067 [Cubamyces sp. BRFM 1775]|nr:hypothetical protein GY45DRAFT_1374067 [Cubamyces sp. BRFM 1775]
MEPSSLGELPSEVGVDMSERRARKRPRAAELSPAELALPGRPNLLPMKPFPRRVTEAVDTTAAGSNWESGIVAEDDARLLDTRIPTVRELMGKYSPGLARIARLLLASDATPEIEWNGPHTRKLEQADVVMVEENVDGLGEPEDAEMTTPGVAVVEMESPALIGGRPRNGAERRAHELTRAGTLHITPRPEDGFARKHAKSPDELTKGFAE